MDSGPGPSGRPGMTAERLAQSNKAPDVLSAEWRRAESPRAATAAGSVA